MRRMFYHWLSTARTSRHRRITLQQKEKEFRLNTLAVAWDKWRERYKAESLRPLVSSQESNRKTLGANSLPTRKMGSSCKAIDMTCSVRSQYGKKRPRFVAYPPNVVALLTKFETVAACNTF